MEIVLESREIDYLNKFALKQYFNDIKHSYKIDICYLSIFVVIFVLVLKVKASMAFFKELLNCKLCNIMVNLFTFHWEHICWSAALCFVCFD